MGNPPYGAYGATNGQFKRWARFGLLDSSSLIIMMLAGFSLDDLIAKKVGHKGYGPLVGAAAGNALTDGLAALPEGNRAAAAVTLGALVPIAPVAIAMSMKKPLKGRTAWAVGISSAVLFLLSFRKTFSSTS